MAPAAWAAGWIKDPKNTLLQWPLPTKCEMIEVLSGLTAVRILGDLTDWYESIALDAVSLKAPASGVSEAPTCAPGSPDASADARQTLCTPMFGRQVCAKPYDYE